MQSKATSGDNATDALYTATK